MIPDSSNLLKPQIARDVKKIIIHNKSRAKLYHDQNLHEAEDIPTWGSKYSRNLQLDQKYGYLSFVVTKAKSRSYDVSVNGGTYCRHSYHMKPAHNQNYRQVLPDTSSSITSPNSFLSSKESIPPVNRNSRNYPSQPNRMQLYNNTTTNIPSSAAPA
jgi:hypothetical protein